MAKSGIYQLVNLRYRERVLWAIFFQVNKVYAYPLLACFLLDNHLVGQPFRVENLFNDSGPLEPVNLLFYSLGVIIKESPSSLFLQCDQRFDV